MAAALFDLEQVLLSKREQEPLTLQEKNIMMAWKARVRRDFLLGIGGGSVVTWLATQRLHSTLSKTLTLGAGVACGIWQIVMSLESSVDRLLSLEGSRIQRELANILLKKYHYNPSVHQRVSNHFYPEEVYDDSSADKPTLRWRYRNFSGEPVPLSQSTFYGEETNPKENNIKDTPKPEPKQVYVTAAADVLENPFDLIFGVAGSAENVPQPDIPTPTASSRRQTRKEKRSRRRHKRHYHHEESDD